MKERERGNSVRELETVIMYAEGYLRMKELQAPEVIQRHMRERAGTDREEFYEEMDLVLHHTEEAYGYRINRIASGKTVYIVTIGKQNGNGEQITEDIGEYDTEKEARSAAEAAEDAENCNIQEMDPEEWWAIIDPDGKNATDMLYPYRERAYVFLLALLGNRVPQWRAFERERYEKNAEENMKADRSVVDNMLQDIKYGGVETQIGFTETMRDIVGQPFDKGQLAAAYADVENVYRNLESFGYRINEIRSGVTRYCVTRDTGNDIEHIGTYETMAEAQSAATHGDEEIEAFDPMIRYALVTLEGKNATGEVYEMEGEAVAYVMDQFPDKVPNFRKWAIGENSPEIQAQKDRVARIIDEYVTGQREGE